MASCPKCGKTKVRKRKSTGLRHCPRCGVINRGTRASDRIGTPPFKIETIESGT